MGGYLKVIDAPVHPDAQAVARCISPDTITNNVIRVALDLQRGGDHDVEIPPATTLKEYFGEYSASGKAYRMYGGPNRAFGEIAYVRAYEPYDHAAEQGRHHHQRLRREQNRLGYHQGRRTPRRLDLVPVR